MLETIFLTAIASVAGVCFRAALENKKPEFYINHSVPIGIGIGVLTFVYYNNIFNSQPTFGSYLGLFFLFFMAGYVLSDLVETLMFIMNKERRKKR